MAYLLDPVGTYSSRTPDFDVRELKAKEKPTASYQSNAWVVHRPGAPCYMGPMGGVHGVFPDTTWRPQCEQEKWPSRKTPPSAK